MISLMIVTLALLYIAISIKSKLPFIALIYLTCEALMMFGGGIKEYQAYYLIFIAYSYVFMLCPTVKNKITCAIICLLAVICANESNLYGVGGGYAERETVLHQNIEYIAFIAHLVFIGSFISFRELRNGLRRFADAFSYVKSYSYSFNII